MRSTIVILFLLLTATAFRTEDPGDTYFSSPIDHTQRLSGTFGELRWNHFHTGIDYKSTNGRPGDPIYAIQEGHLSRVKVEEDGYGRALYIDHPNGFTSVYAHLHQFSDRITNWVRDYQHKKQSFAIDAYLPDTAIKVSKGELIGTMGNAGSSSGVHLHFELRDTDSEIPCNPLLIGYSAADERPPDVFRMKWTAIDSNYQELASRVYRLRNTGGNVFRTNMDTVHIPATRTGLSVQSNDRLDGAWNRNGIYGMELYLDSSKVYSFQMRCIPFEHLRFLNAHIDYAERYHNRRYYHRLHQLPGNKLGIYDSVLEGGYIRLRQGAHRQVKINIRDVAGNVSTIEFPVKAEASLPSKHTESNEWLMPDREFRYKDSNCSIYFPKGSVYRPIPWSYSWNQAEDDLAEFKLLEEDVPLHKGVEIKIPLDSIKVKNWPYIHLQRKNKGQWEYAGGQARGNVLYASLDQAGTYRLQVDSVGPEIRAVAMSRNLNGWNRISFRIDDGAEAHPLTFEGCIDGAWILMEYDEKNSLLTHSLSDTLSGTHRFELTVWDDRMNESRYSLSFQR